MKRSLLTIALLIAFGFSLFSETISSKHLTFYKEAYFKDANTWVQVYVKDGQTYSWFGFGQAEFIQYEAAGVRIYIESEGTTLDVRELGPNAFEIMAVYYKGKRVD